MIHTIKGFSIVDEAEIDVFLEFSCYLYDPIDVDNLISGSFDFSKPSLYIWEFSVHVLLKPSLKDFEHNLTSMWNEHNCTVVWTFFGNALLWDWNENLLLQFYVHCWGFQICWHTEYSTLTASSFRILNSSAGIPSPSITLFVVMLPKAHLTSDSRMSGSRWVITPLWLSVSLRPFMSSSSVYSCHLFLIPSASIRSLPLLSFIVPSLHGLLPWHL